MEKRQHVPGGNISKKVARFRAVRLQMFQQSISVSGRIVGSIEIAIIFSSSLQLLHFANLFTHLLYGVHFLDRILARSQIFTGKGQFRSQLHDGLGVTIQ